MPRFTIEGDPITVAYGFDICSEIFLSVTDNRLEYKDEASDEVNQVAESIGVKDGGGSYFDSHTGSIGFGRKVSNETMRVYLSRYGVEKQRIDQLFEGHIQSDQPCEEKMTEAMENLKLSKSQKKRIKKKEKRAALSKDLPFLIDITTGKSVNAIYLPEIGDKPVFVQVPIKSVFDESDDSYWSKPELDSFIGKGKPNTCSYIPRNPLNDKRVMHNMLELTYRDDFLVDGCSKKNEVVHKMTKGKLIHDWRGPIVVMKVRGLNLNLSQDYLDIELSDLPDIVDYFLWYGSGY